MANQKQFSLLSFFTLLVTNLLLGGGLYYLGSNILSKLQGWVNQPVDAGADNVTVTVQNIVAFLNDFIPQNREQLMLFAIGLAVAATLIGWLIIQLLAKRTLGSTPTAAKAKPAKMDENSPAPAIQLLSILQRDGRLLDFLNEDLSSYDDAQIGAAVRNVHEGCKKALNNCFQMKPVMSQQEGSEVNVPHGFDARQIRLIGNVVGEPPFSGSLRHKGWKITRVDLPKQTKEQSENKVVAAAEVEVR
ncbi:MAG: DUF2760 domain-containing protein [Calditrichia bacterium]